MGIIRCPSCNRWLVLPAGAWDQAAQCPGCRTVFTPSSEPPGSSSGSQEERFHASETGIGEEERIREYRAGPPRKHRRGRANRSAGALKIGRAEKTVFWIGFFLGILEALTLGKDQAEPDVPPEKRVR
jgi:hypothetical protein